MIKPIMKDPFFLARASEDATQEDIFIGKDLIDTLTAHADECVGMAANMIGVRKRVIIVDHDGRYVVMFNPKIIKKSRAYEAEEGCLSLTGTRKAKRWWNITVQYEDIDFQPFIKSFFGRTAQAIQHELDHCDGVLI